MTTTAAQQLVQLHSKYSAITFARYVERAPVEFSDELADAGADVVVVVIDAVVVADDACRY